MRVFFFVLYALFTGYTSAERIVCYYGSWATYRQGNGQCSPSHLDPFVCTHLIYSFAGLDTNNRIVSLDPHNDLQEGGGQGGYKKFNDLRLQNPGLKTILAIGGWNEGSVKYSLMSSTPESRRAFVQSVLEFLQRYNFQGLDLDWEYPGNRGGSTADKENFIKLIEELRTEFDKKGFLLTAAVAAGKYTIDTAYKVSFLAQYLDFINVMTYDFHGSWETTVNHHAPLYRRPDDIGDNIYLNINFTMNYYIDQGVPPSKLNLGLPSYAVVFTLANPNNNVPTAPASGVGISGPYTQQGGFLGYNELCEKMKTQSWTVVRDQSYKSPYAYYGNQWAGYDDSESIKVKTLYAKSLGLGGVMLWSIETEDFLGICGKKFPLLNAAREVFGSPSETTTTPPTTTQATTKPPTTTVTTTQPTTTVTTTQPTTTVTTTQPTTTVTTTQRTTTVTTTQPTRTVTTTQPITTVTTTQPTTQSPTTTTTTQTTQPPVVTTTQLPADLEASLKANCATVLAFRHPTDCQIFYQCVKVGDDYKLAQLKCPPRTSFNNVIQVCDWSVNVEGCH